MSQFPMTVTVCHTEGTYHSSLVHGQERSCKMGSVVVKVEEPSLADDPQAVERGAKAFWTEDAFTEAGWENENPGVRQWYINQAETVLRAAEND